MEGKRNNTIIVIFGIIILALAGYIVYADFIAKKAEPKSVESVQSAVQSMESKISDEKEDNSVKRMIGYYKNEQRVMYNGQEEVMFYMDLYLCDNNMYIFSDALTSVPEATSGGQIGSNTSIGSYKVEGNKLYLYQILSHGNGKYDGDFEAKTIVLDIANEKTINISDDLVRTNNLSGNYTKDVTKSDGNTENAKENIYDTFEGTLNFYKEN